VDAHRSLLLTMSPYVQSGYISHRHSSMGSIQKTIYELLGIGSLNLEDALTADLSDMFSMVPNPIPYTVLPEDNRVFDPSLARTAKPRTARERAELLDVDDGTAIRREFSAKKAGASRPGNPAATSGPLRN